ncbi:hypothetical protein BX070DRAFT_102480 [Coemansia spiralis]|nr:hypothetical protein BX070DRAFT_102480 [Coemansia spiralis]
MAQDAMVCQNKQCCLTTTVVDVQEICLCCKLLAEITAAAFLIEGCHWIYHSAIISFFFAHVRHTFILFYFTLTYFSEPTMLALSQCFYFIDKWLLGKTMT